MGTGSYMCFCNIVPYSKNFLFTRRCLSRILIFIIPDVGCRIPDPATTAKEEGVNEISSLSCFCSTKVYKSFWKLFYVWKGTEKNWPYWQRIKVIFLKNQCCGSGMFIPDPGSDFFPSRIRTVCIPDPGSSSKNLSILTPKTKKWFLSSRKYDPGCSSRIRMLTFYPSRQGFGSGSAWIRINLSCWIRIRIQIADPDPDPGGGKNYPKNRTKENFHLLKCWMFTFEGWRLLL